jgi:hypothetical protein
VIFAEADARSTALKSPANRLSLRAVPPLQEIAVGQLFHARALVESTLPVEVTMIFPEVIFDLLTGQQSVQVPEGTHTLDWSLYVKPAPPSDSRLKFQARSGGLYQTAELIVRIVDANS